MPRVWFQAGHSRGLRCWRSWGEQAPKQAEQGQNKAKQRLALPRAAARPTPCPAHPARAGPHRIFPLLEVAICMDTCPVTRIFQSLACRAAWQPAESQTQQQRTTHDPNFSLWCCPLASTSGLLYRVQPPCIAGLSGIQTPGTPTRARLFPLPSSPSPPPLSIFPLQECNHLSDPPLTPSPLPARAPCRPAASQIARRERTHHVAHRACWWGLGAFDGRTTCHRGPCCRQLRGPRPHHHSLPER